MQPDYNTLYQGSTGTYIHTSLSVSRTQISSFYCVEWTTLNRGGLGTRSIHTGGDKRYCQPDYDIARSGSGYGIEHSGRGSYWLEGKPFCT